MHHWQHFVLEVSDIMFTQRLRKRTCSKPVAEFVSELRALKPKDITNVVGKMLKSPVSLAAHGEITSIPRYDSLQSRFR